MLFAPVAEPVREGWLDAERNFPSREIHDIQDLFRHGSGDRGGCGFFEVASNPILPMGISRIVSLATSNQRNDAYGGDRAGRMPVLAGDGGKRSGGLACEQAAFVRISSVDSMAVTEAGEAG